MLEPMCTLTPTMDQRWRCNRIRANACRRSTHVEGIQIAPFDDGTRRAHAQASGTRAAADRTLSHAALAARGSVGRSARGRGARRLRVARLLGSLGAV